MQRKVSASTQNQAFISLLTFFRLVFNTELDDLKHAVRARTGKRLPVVFSVEEVREILRHTEGTSGLILKMIYGGGLRVNEGCRLRIKDIDFDQQLINVRNGKGGKDRTTLLPASLTAELKAHIARVIDLHVQDLAEGFGSVWLPDALAGKYPGAPEETTRRGSRNDWGDCTSFCNGPLVSQSFSSSSPAIDTVVVSQL